MKPEELLKYELSSIAEFCSIGWMQSVLAWWYAKKVNRKWKRYNVRLNREKYLREKGLIKS